MEKTYKFSIPQDKKVEKTNVRIENGEIIFDIELTERFEPKDGDFCVSDNGYIFIFKNEFTSSHFERCASSYYGFDSYGVVDYNLCYVIEHGRFATQKEKLHLIKSIKKAYKRKWDEKSKELKEIRWKPEKGEIFYFVDTIGEVQSSNRGCWLDDGMISIGNSFKTKSAAQKVADEIKEIFKNSKPE